MHTGTNTHAMRMAPTVSAAFVLRMRSATHTLIYINSRCKQARQFNDDHIIVRTIQKVIEMYCLQFNYQRNYEFVQCDIVVIFLLNFLLIFWIVYSILMRFPAKFSITNAYSNHVENKMR